MTHEERETVRALVAMALPKCCNHYCESTATRCQESHCVDCGPDEYYCDEHGDCAMSWSRIPELPYAPALRKVQAMLDNEKSVAASACDASAVFTMLAEDGVQFATFTHDARGRRIVEVDLPLRGRATFVIHANDTTETLVETIRRYNAQAKL